MFLLDTNVVAELRRRKPHGAVVAWVASVAASQLYLPAVVLGELQAGIELTRQQDAGKARQLEEWLEQVASTSSILPMDGAILRLWAKLMHGKNDTLLEDAMIAATAQVHDLTVVTRNIRDFAVFAVPTLDPFASVSPRVEPVSRRR